MNEIRDPFYLYQYGTILRDHKEYSQVAVDRFAVEFVNCWLLIILFFNRISFNSLTTQLSLKNGQEARFKKIKNMEFEKTCLPAMLLKWHRIYQYFPVDQNFLVPFFKGMVCGLSMVLENKRRRGKRNDRVLQMFEGSIDRFQCQRLWIHNKYHNCSIVKVIRDNLIYSYDKLFL